MKKTLLTVAVCAIFIGQPIAQPSFFPQDVQDVCSAIPDLIDIPTESYTTNKEAWEKYEDNRFEYYKAEAKCSLVQATYLKTAVKAEYEKALKGAKDKVALRKIQEQFTKGMKDDSQEEAHDFELIWEEYGSEPGLTKGEDGLWRYVNLDGIRSEYAQQYARLAAWNIPWPTSSKTVSTCRNRNGAVNEKCVIKAFPLVEKQMAASLKKSLAKATNKKALETDQAQWKSWMENFCGDAMVGYSNGKTKSEFYDLECEANLTRVRTAQLNEWAKTGFEAQK